VRTRQPLSRAVVAAPGFAELAAAAADHPGQERELLAEIADELNVAAVETAGADLVEIEVKPNYRALGTRFPKRTPLAPVPVTASADAPVDGVLTVTVDGEAIALSGDEIVVSESPREGWAVRSEGGLSVGLDTELTDELREAGLLRDVLRFVQDARKQLGFEVSDRIELWWTASRTDTASAVRNGTETLAAECLAVSVTEDEGPSELTPLRSEDLGLTVWARIA
jgi:isoleucyl-tRNA synthetase